LPKKQLIIFFFCLLLVLPKDVPAEEVEVEKRYLAFAGAGLSKDGWGNTHQQVETLDLVFRQDRPQQRIRGNGRWVNRKSVFVEIPVSWIYSPDRAPFIGFTMNVAWQFLYHPNKQPYLFIGGGPGYTQADIPGTSSHIKGTYQLGVGIEFKPQTPSRNLFLELRYHHMSNGGIKVPNDSVNSLKLLFGTRF
jgi:hypothetical protein